MKPLPKLLCRFLTFSLFFVIYASTILAQNKFVLIDPLQPIFPDSNQVSAYSTRYALDFPKGTVADVHLLLQVPIGETVSVTAIYQNKVLPVAYWSRLVDVPVEQNTGIDSRTEQYLAKTNPYAIRRAPFRIYEAIEPLKTNSFVTQNAFTALRLSIPPDVFSRTGKHRIKIRVQTNNWKGNGEFTAQVYPANLPKLENSRFFYTNWFRLSELETRHHTTRWTDDWYAMLDKYAALMAYGRQNAVNIPGELIYVQDGKFVLDEDKMLRFINVFRKYGFKYFESPHLMDRGKNDDWGDPQLKVALTGKPYNTPEAKVEIAAMIGLIKDFTSKYNLTHSWLQHISDEPTRIQADSYKAVAAQVKSIYPEIKIMEATNDRDGIVGAVDVWCPLINDFQENEAFFRAREAQNEQVLVYTCLIPGGPWLNRLLDEERLRPVYFGWGAAFYNTSGYLHWGLNQYFADPWQQSVVHHPAPGAAENNFLPAGDTHVIYPSESGPLSSTRFEAHRIGIEDYELLTDLKAKNPTLADQLIRQVFRSYTDYSKSVPTYRTTRKALLEALK
jgi:hypothetical protein